MSKTLKLISLLLLATAALCAGCKNGSEKIVVGASATPHAAILEQTKQYVKGKGYELEIRVFDDYVLPNYALENKELDANYFQHKPYLEDFNAKNGTSIVPVLDVHFEPMGIYRGKKNSVSEFAENDKIAVPSDKSNNDRALALLAQYGMKKADIIEMEAQTIPLAIEDCAFVVANGNYALSSGIIDRCIATEDKDGNVAKEMANVIAVKKGSENDAKTNVLIDALKQPNVADFVSSTYGSSVIYVAS